MIKLITPHWPAPSGITAYSTTRHGGVSLPPRDSLNLGDHCGDNPAHVAENRQRLAQAAKLPASPVWLEQVHGSEVLRCDSDVLPVGRKADACWSNRPGVVCTVMTADCLPVLFCSVTGDEVAAAHAGWRGLCAGILEQTIGCFHCAPASLLAWLGPAIGAQAFEVGAEVRSAFIAHNGNAACAFHPQGEKYLADLYQLARLRLHAAGVRQIYAADYCTVQQASDFFSWRRDGITGRMASFIWRH